MKTAVNYASRCNGIVSRCDRIVNRCNGIVRRCDQIVSRYNGIVRRCDRMSATTMALSVDAMALQSDEKNPDYNLTNLKLRTCTERSRWRSLS